jgi:hypothetical protein
MEMGGNHEQIDLTFGDYTPDYLSFLAICGENTYIPCVGSSGGGLL